MKVGQAKSNYDRMQFGESQRAMRRAKRRYRAHHPSKSQVAAHLIEQGFFPGEQLAKGRRDGDLAEMLANRHGTNRAYIFEAVKLRDRSRPVFALVASGYLTFSQAQAALELRKVRPADFKKLIHQEFTRQEVRQLVRPFLTKPNKAKLPADPVKEIMAAWRRCNEKQRNTVRKKIGSNN
jgi:hypothetical protein